MAKQTRGNRSKAKQGLFAHMGWWVVLARVKFLPESLLMVLVGAAASMRHVEFASFQLLPLLLAWLLTWTSQLSTHFFSEYFDFKADTLNQLFSKWTGGSRVLVDGHLPRSAALLAGCFMAALSVTALLLAQSSPSCEHVVPPLMPLLMLSLLLGYSYSGPPLSLHYKCLGELTIAVVFAVLAPAAGYSSQTASPFWHMWRDAPFMAYLQAVMFMQQFARCLVMNMPDMESDRHAGKLSLACVLGHTAASAAYLTIQASAAAAAAAAAYLKLLPLELGTALLLGSPLAYNTGMHLLRKGSNWQRGEDDDSPLHATLHQVTTALGVLLAMVGPNALALAGSALRTIKSGYESLAYT